MYPNESELLDFCLLAELAVFRVLGSNSTIRVSRCLLIVSNES